MRSLGTLVVAGVACVLLALPSIVLADGRVALVVGNSSYAHIGRLSNPENDAADMSAALRRLGFEVTTELDLDLGELNGALRAFRSAGADVSLVFYAGHGIELNGANYLVPVDARLELDTDVRFETVTLDDVLAATAGAALRLVILDACRNNPLAGGTRSISRGSLGAPEEEQLGTEVLVAYAAQAGTVALDGRGRRNSPYTAALLAHLEQPLELNTMFRRVRGHVLEATGHGQQPWEYGALVGDHYLRMEVVVDRSLADSEETVFWESIRESSKSRRFRSVPEALSDGHLRAVGAESTAVTGPSGARNNAPRLPDLSGVGGGSSRVVSHAAGTARVGSFAANAWGLHDVAENVREWVEDCWHQNYTGAPRDGSAWVGRNCISRVSRGGSWIDYSNSMRPAGRIGVVPGNQIYFNGFRVARTLD